MAQTEPRFRQVETVQLAPDAVLFINGTDTVTDDNGNAYQIRNDVTDMNVSMSIDAVPGTAGFTLSIPEHSIRRSGSTRYDSLKIMSEVEIYMKGRFPKQNADDTVTYPYYPVFWGVITSVTENYSDGVHTVQVSCADILRWWDITKLQFNPSIMAATANPAEQMKVTNSTDQQQSLSTGTTIENKDGNNLSVFGTVFANKTPQEILVALAKVSVKEMQPLHDYLSSSVSSAEKIGNQLANEADIKEMMDYWVVRLDKIGRGIRVYGLKADGTPDYSLISGTMFPYPLSPSAPPITQSIVKSYLEIMNEVKEFVQWEFFLDVTGEIVFKPPFYNMNVVTNPNSVIKDIDIHNWNFTASESEIVTRIDVHGSWMADFNSSRQDVGVGIAIDTKLAQKYGLRVTTREVNWATTPEKCYEYAQLELNRINAMASSGSVTITGRPELRLGYPVFIPSRDAFYYITGIDHGFTFGGSFTTTLTLKAERKRLLDPNGDPIKHQIFRNVGTVGDTEQPVQGTSLADSAGSDNYMKHIIDACVPSKRNRTDASQASFLKSFDRTKTTVMGQWESTSGVQLSDSADSTVEFQTTDGDGFELIPFFKYGNGMQFSNASIVEQFQTEQLSAFRINATAAQNLNPDDHHLTVNPNNVALTLDNADGSMLSMYDTTPGSVAQQAQKMDIGNKTV